MSFLENDWLSQIPHIFSQNDASVIKGPGDDAAVVRRGHGRVLLYTTDAQIQDVHFTLPLFTLRQVGMRAAAVNFSDIAAMGGVPRQALISVAAPQENSDQIGELLSGFATQCEYFGVTVIGGNLSASKQGWQIHVTVIGEGEESKIKMRSQAKPGDLLFVSGMNGLSHLGRLLLQKNSTRLPTARKKHILPVPRVELGKRLADIPDVHALMDVSDGLAMDVERLAQSSNGRVVIDLKLRPRDDAFDDVCRELYLDPDSVWFTGGEDYELLFSASEAVKDQVLALSQDLNLEINIIGKFLACDSQDLRVTVLDRQGQPWAAQEKIYQHFAGKL